MTGEWLTIEQACQQLDVSRPTLNKWRQQKKIKHLTVGGRIKLSKLDLINKIILPQPEHTAVQLSVDKIFNIDNLQTMAGVFDLRGLKRIDAYGIMQLLSAIKLYLNESDSRKIYLLSGEDPDLCSYLDAAMFFSEVRRGHQAQVFIHGPKLKTTSPDTWSILQPLHLVGYNGGEKKQLDHVTKQLLEAGFSDTLCGHVAWLVGELCDNAHAHSRRPCHFMIEGVDDWNQSTQVRSLLIAVGDAGIGIAQSLKNNKKYQCNSDAYLLLHAFVSKVTSSLHPRGKGLTDVLNIVKGRKSFLRINSQGLDAVFDFSKPKNNIHIHIDHNNIKPSHKGTSFALLLHDLPFDSSKLNKSSIQQTNKQIAIYQKENNL